MTQALSGLRVLDAGESIAGQYCGRLLADFGADVTLWEPQGGSVTRRQPPFSDRDGSLLFLHLNWGKHHGDWQPGTPAPAGTDIAILPAGADHAALRAADPRLITCTVSDFGEDGPRRNWKGGELVVQALSGVMFRNGDPKRDPLYGVGHRSAYVTGVVAYSAVLSAIFARARTGSGQHISIDRAETAASMTYFSATQYNYNQRVETRTRPANTPGAVLRCADGWVSVFLYAYRWRACCAALGREDMVTDPLYAESEARMENWKSAVAELQKSAAGLEAADLVERLQSAGCPASMAVRPSQLANSPHLRARDYWERAGDRLMPGPPFRLERTPRRILEEGHLP